MTPPKVGTCDECGQKDQCLTLTRVAGLETRLLMCHTCRDEAGCEDCEAES